MINKLVGIVLVLGIGVLSFLFIASNVGTIRDYLPGSNGVATTNTPTFAGKVMSAAGASVVGGDESDFGLELDLGIRQGASDEAADWGATMGLTFSF